MTDYRSLHEAEDIWLTLKEPSSIPDLWCLLTAAGFTLSEDVFSLDRNDKPPIWQSSSIASVQILDGESEVYEEEGQWNKLRLRYFLATLPVRFIQYFVDHTSRLAEALKVPMTYEGKEVSADQLRFELGKCTQELRAITGEPGSEEVAILVESTYPR